MISRIRIADGNAEKSSVRKCQNLAVLDRTFDSIYQGPDVAANVELAMSICLEKKNDNDDIWACAKFPHPRVPWCKR